MIFPLADPTTSAARPLEWMTADFGAPKKRPVCAIGELPEITRSRRLVRQRRELLPLPTFRRALPAALWSDEIPDAGEEKHPAGPLEPRVLMASCCAGSPRDGRSVGTVMTIRRTLVPCATKYWYLDQEMLNGVLAVRTTPLRQVPPSSSAMRRQLTGATGRATPARTLPPVTASLRICAGSMFQLPDCAFPPSMVSRAGPTKPPASRRRATAERASR